MLTAATTGFLSGFALILAIGAQNAFVLRQGLLREHVFPLCLFCAMSDAILITAGVAGFGALVTAFPTFPTVMMLAGAVFLLVYGATRFRAAWRGDYEMTLDGQGLALWPTLGIAAAFTWLNPHVYLDTLGLMGALSTQYDALQGRVAFGVGGALASFVFFFSLGYGARLLAPIMQSARAWRRLDVLIGVVMWLLAIKLLWPLIS
ncbi:LysE/ArgO family amino acid transporter [Shimia ponticola]|uniref:LysE/ArgO family amino acid transporter n=1 Tax=Shimia ponticola TaxID=2582893 RepID=UPI0011BD8DE3|nr:LysE/ArgO family amino acid transporter [Shimia ponticola]